MEDTDDRDLVLSLQSKLNSGDEVLLLPQTYISKESGVFKNAIFKFNKDKKNLSTELFSENWFSGISAVKLTEQQIQDVLQNRSKSLNALKNAVSSEHYDDEIQIGPDLDGDLDDRDTVPWTAGFDTSSCCCGIYASEETYTNDTNQGMTRPQRTFYLVCKAGGGVAAQAFHSRFVAALSNGASLEEALGDEGVPGSRALRRVTQASVRNRARILAEVATALNLDINTISDNVAVPTAPARQAVVDLNIAVNTIKKSENDFLYCTALDADLSLGLVTMVNAQAGMTFFLNQHNSFKFRLKNQAFGCIPYSTERLLKDREAVARATGAFLKHGESGHFDKHWIRAHFSWKNSAANSFDPRIDELEPPSLWGTHLGTSSTKTYTRELGLASLKAVDLRPELVVVTGTDSSQSKAFLRQIKEGAF